MSFNFYDETITFLKLLLVVVGILLFFKSKAGKKIDQFLPLPFWIYFVPIILTNIGLLPSAAFIYDYIALFLLPAAIFLMLIGTSLRELKNMGPLASKAMAIAVVTIYISQIISFLLTIKFLPDYGWQAVGSLMGTWIGGSANMVAVKEILKLPDQGLPPLILTDVIFSYGWMAILIVGANFQKVFDRSNPTLQNNAEVEYSSDMKVKTAVTSSIGQKINQTFVVAIAGFLFSLAMVLIAKVMKSQVGLLSWVGWAVLLTSILTLVLSPSPINKIRGYNPQSVGYFYLYLVLVSIGAKTSLSAVQDVPVFILYALLVFIFHGTFLLCLGKYFKVPLYMLSIASQANIGGAVSAPIVAEVYKPGTAHLGVLMAVLGAILGTYLGVSGGLLCRWLQTLI